MPTGRERVLDDLIMIRMPKRLRKALEELAEKDRRALAEYVRLLLEDHVEARKKRK